MLEINSTGRSGNMIWIWTDKCPFCGAKFVFENVGFVEYECRTKVF